MKIKVNKDILKSDFDKETLEHIDNLYTYALLITGDEGKAEKVIKQTYAKAYWFYPYLSAETNIKIWLQRIVMNLLHNTIKQLEEPDSPESEQSLTKINYNLLNQRENFAFRDGLVNKISILPSAMKDVLILKDVLGYNLEETADLIDIPEGTVNKRLFDARRSLFIILEQDDYNPVITSANHIPYADKKLIASVIEDYSENDSLPEKYHKFKEETEVQIFIKSIIKKHFTVQQVRDAVTLKIIKKFAPELKNTFKRKTGTENKKMVFGATIAMIILIIVMIMLSRPEFVNPGDLAALQKGKNNIYLMLKDSYLMYEKGDYKHAITHVTNDSLNYFLSHYKIDENSFIEEFQGWVISGLFFTELNPDYTLCSSVFSSKFSGSLQI